MSQKPVRQRVAAELKARPLSVTLAVVGAVATVLFGIVSLSPAEWSAWLPILGPFLGGFALLSVFGAFVAQITLWPSSSRRRSIGAVACAALGAVGLMLFGGLAQRQVGGEGQETVIRLGTLFCSRPTPDRCFNARELRIEETPSTPGLSNYSYSLTGYWSGVRFNELTDLWWAASFNHLETSPLGGLNHFVPMVPGEPTSSLHEVFGHPQGLGPPALSTLSMSVWLGQPGQGGGESLTACGGGCVGPWEP